ncbi:MULTISPECIES: type VI secretion system tip protein TssI/VgrG [unclassified Serratia (in: enterobacteria)]|uniref:type VI secretion system tip protein TssI/VgrG n=1 Tax=unclassified Serratia (in: enterobacteria) TaxID=2647522 RepID=UPI000469DEE8|nr:MULTISPECIES: type VI secretion system tip protein TssI/VgrG [unclassified Serratia (in: enterobacteria)]
MDNGLFFSSQLGELPEDTFDVAGFTLEEGLSTLFTLTVSLVSTRSDIELAAQLLQPGSLTVTVSGEEQRTIPGLIASLTQGESGFRRTYYQAVIRPDVWVLSLKQDSRIFHFLSVPDIVNKVLDEHHIPYQSQLQQTYPPREYVTQKRESDLDFILRLMAEVGITFWFEDNELVYGDSHLGMTEGVPVTFNPHIQSPTQGDIAHRLTLGAFMQSRESVLKDREHRRPDHPLQFKQSDPELGGETTQYSVFESYGRYQDDQTGPQFSTLRLEAMQAGTQQGEAETNSIRLMPGTIFTLHGHPVQARNDRWQVITVSHRGEQPAALEEESNGSGTTFTNSLTFAPGNIDWRPSYRYKPLADGDEVATIVGPKGEELYVNELGWVRVHFHWNRYDPADEKASCWVPVSNQWAGDGFGSVTLPRIGQEVLISYLNGDIDRPVVSGRYYNGLNKPPYPLPDNKTRSVWRTKSHKAEGFNELSFEDEAGSEEIFLHAQKDLKALVNNDAHWDIRANQHSKIGGNSLSDIEGNQETRIKGELTLHTSGKKSELADGESHLQVGSAYVVKAGQEVSVEAGAKITLSAGSELTLKAGGSFIKLAPGAIFTSSSLMVGSGSAGSGQGVNLKMPGVVPLLAAPTLIQQGVLSSDAPYCEECEKCKEGGCAIDESPAAAASPGQNISSGFVQQSGGAIPATASGAQGMPGSGWASTGGVSQALPNVGSLPISGLTAMADVTNLSGATGKDYLNMASDKLKGSQSADMAALFNKMGKKS